MPYNKKAVLAANTQAIRIILRLEKEQRLATEEERIILGAYQGFGGLKCVLNRTEQPEDIRYWAKSEQELFKPTCALKQLIYREAPDALIAKRYWESIKASVLTSFYTDTRIVSAIATALAETGVEFRSCLNPSSGIGAFADTFAPYARRIDALEKDLLTARIAQALHPLGESKVTVRQAAFESLGELAEADRYDLITSNIPFGDFMVYDRAYSKGKDSIKREATRTIHNYFFIKGLDSLREGGILAFITSQGLLDSPYNEIFRRYLMEQSRLISAIRLPSGMFSEHAGTEVGSDLIILQKQTGKGITPGEEERFVRTAAVPSGDGFSIAFTHNSLLEGSGDEVRSHTIASERTMGTNPYGKAAWVYQFDGDMDEMADSLRIQLAQDVALHFDRKLYKIGVATTEEERQTEAEKKLLALGVTVGSPQKETQKKDKDKLYQIKEREELVQGHFTKERLLYRVQPSISSAKASRTQPPDMPLRSGT